MEPLTWAELARDLVGRRPIRAEPMLLVSVFTLYLRAFALVLVASTLVVALLWPLFRGNGGSGRGSSRAT